MTNIIEYYNQHCESKCVQEHLFIRDTCNKHLCITAVIYEDFPPGASTEHVIHADYMQITCRLL